MLPSPSQTESRAKRRMLLFFGIVAVAALALPTIKWALRLQSPVLSAALADDKAPPADTAKGAAGADRRDKPGTGMKGRDAAVEAEYLPRPCKFEEEFLAALEKPADVEFLDLALEDCLAFLREAASIPIWLDKQTLTDEGIAMDQPVTLKLTGGRLESVLHLLLKPVQLTFLPEDDVMVVTTSAKAGEKLITRTYPVRDLYQGRNHLDIAGAPQKAVAPAAGALPGPAKAIEGAGDAAKGDEKGAQPKAAQPVPRVRYADLEEAMINTIEPDSWDELSGPGSYTYVKETGCLVVRQTWAVHRQILQLLRDLREAKHLAPGGKALTPTGDSRK